MTDVTEESHSVNETADKKSLVSNGYYGGVDNRAGPTLQTEGNKPSPEGHDGESAEKQPISPPTTAHTDSSSSCSTCCEKHCKLFPNKSFYFSFIGGVGCIMPYVSIYLKQLGLSPQEIGLISGIRPIVGFLSAPFWGMIADRFSIRKIILLISILAWVGFFLALFHIPPPSIQVPPCPHPARQQKEDAQVFRRTYSLDRIQGRGKRDVDENPLPLLPVAFKPDDELGNSSLRTVIGLNTTGANMTDQDLQLMREYLGWLYEPRGLRRVFTTALIIIVGGEFFQSPTTALADTGTLQMLEAAGVPASLYGNQRAWGALGYGISSFLGGGLVSMTRTQETLCGVHLHFSDYRILSYVFSGFMFFAFIAATQIKFRDDKTSEKQELKNGEDKKVDDTDNKDSYSTVAVLKVFANVHYGSWLSTAFFVGVCNGVIWGFLYWHLENLGASQLMMGVASVVACTSEFITFFLVNYVINVIGHMGIMYLGLFGYSLRFVVYAVIVNPWWVLPAEFLQGITFSLIWVSLTSYTTVAVPSFSLATVQGIVHGVYFGLGTGTGNLIGGILIGFFGARATFFAFSVACIVVLFIFLIAQKCSTKPPTTVYGYKDLDAETKAVD